MESYDTTRSEERKAETVKKCTKIMLKCLRICKVKKSSKKDPSRITKDTPNATAARSI